MPTADDVMAAAYRYRGQPYVFGAEVRGCDETGPVDCSELVEAACRCAGVEPSVPDGSWLQYAYCESNGTLIPLATALSVRGALLFYSRTDPPAPGRSGIYHVAFSEGDGRTFEAWMSSKPVGNYSAQGRPWFRLGALIPGVEYPDVPPVALPPENTTFTIPFDKGGAMTLRELNVTSPFMKGADVRSWQVLLRDGGYKPGGVDGVYGPRTEAAVRACQRAWGLAVDGILGPRTGEAILERG